MVFYHHLPNVKGLVFDLNSVYRHNIGVDSRPTFGLVGYRIEYLQLNPDEKIHNFFRLVTSNFLL